MHTILFSYILTDIVSTLVIILLWIQNRKRFQGTGLWVLGKKRSWTLNGILVVVFLLIHSWFTFVHPNLSIRNVNLSLFGLVFFSLCAWLLFFGVTSQTWRMTRFEGIRNYAGIIENSSERAMISTVLRNLFSNAIKFTSRGGAIEISLISKEDKLEFSISDNGIGISPDAMADLFTIGQSKTSLGTEDETGTGLGLVLCKEFIEKHEGRIWVESVPGKGSTFYFSLPKR